MDIETILYIIFFIIFIVARLFKGVKDKAAAERPVIPDHTGQQRTSSKQPQQEKKPSYGDIFGDLLEEFEGERKKHYEPVKKDLASEPKPKVAKEEQADFIDPQQAKKLMDQEGVSAFNVYGNETAEVTGEEITDSFDDDLTKSEIGEGGGEQQFQFDPREAFLLKSLLERPYK